MTSEEPQLMTPNQVIAAWRNFDGFFPEESFKAVYVPYEALTERLLDEIEDAIDFPDEFEEHGYWSSHFALYTLAWHREKRTLIPLKRLFKETGYSLFDLWDDTVAEDGARLFASWAYTDPDALKPIIELRPKRGDTFRADALEGYLPLYHAGAVTADSMRPYLLHLADSVLRRRDDVGDDWMWYIWGRCCIEMGLEDMYPLVKQSFDEGWVDADTATWEETEAELRAGREAVLEQSRGYYGTLIADPFTEMRDWYCFTEEARQEELRLAQEEEERFSAATPTEILFHPNTIVNETPKPKPNQPCPCGSGKKFKKCCGRE